jgi:7-cyano-7-deazaguanine synthase
VSSTGAADTVAVVSGGLDSVTLAHVLAAEGRRLHVVSVDYGQRHRRELDFAIRCAERLGAAHDVIDLRSVGALLSGSALTDASVEVPDGHYEEASMAATVVPNRNAILLAVAYGVAVARGIATVAVGVHAGDHAVYPDCRPEFVAAFDAMERVATEGYAAPGLSLLAPFIGLRKQDIVARGAQLGVPFAQTWSCYRGAAVHCGTCGTCTERIEAFALAGVTDPTDYARHPAPSPR